MIAENVYFIQAIFWANFITRQMGMIFGCTANRKLSVIYQVFTTRLERMEVIILL